jgi:geranylgeranyl diphosphate synthase type II
MFCENSGLTEEDRVQELMSFLEESRRLVDEALEVHLPPESEEPRKLHRAMRYSVFAGGKRIRPALVIAASDLHDGPREAALPAACAMEMIHTYSLIHDDLPAMDDDDLRRGRPSCHKAFDEATAILAGDALLTHAFLILARQPAPSPERMLGIIDTLAEAAGTGGMIGGQMADLESENRQVDLATVERIHLLKTAALITASLVIGAVMAGAGEEELIRMKRFGRHIGLLFQITDDILDRIGDTKNLGKTVGKDEAQGKATYPAAAGMEMANSRAEELARQAAEELAPYGERAGVLLQLTDYLLRRSH